MLDLAAARLLVYKVVEEQGRDFRYAGEKGYCFYVPTSVVLEWVRDDLVPRTRPEVTDLFAKDYDPTTDIRQITGCLAGRVLTEAGETRHQTPMCLNMGVWQLFTRFPDMMTEEVATYLASIQDKQDDGYSWGEAYDLAEFKLDHESCDHER